MPRKDIINRIRGCRIERGLTQTDLAEKCNVSKSLISKVEANKASLHLDLLLDIASALNVTVSELLDEYPAKKKAMVVREKDRKKWVAGVPGKIGYKYYRLATPIDSKVDSFFLVIGPEAGKSQRFVMHEGREFVYVLEGKTKLVFRDEAYLLKAGDTAFFDSSEGHKLIPVETTGLCQVLVLFVRV